MIHYDGNHNRRNALNYEFLGRTFFTSEQNLGQQIEYSVHEVLALGRNVAEIMTFPRLSARSHFASQLNDSA